MGVAKILKMKIEREAGLTIIELLVSIAISAIVASAIFGVFDSNNRLYTGERKVVSMQGSAKIAIESLARSLRHIGYDPKGAGVDVFGLSDPLFSASPTALITSNSDIYFTADTWDGDLALPENGTRNSQNEFFAFRLNGTDLERANIIDTAGTIGSWSVVTSNITSLLFVYGYANGTSSDAVGLPDNNIAGRNFQDVRTLKITVTARTEGNHNLTGTPSTETVSTTIKLRNNVEL